MKLNLKTQILDPAGNPVRVAGSVNPNTMQQATTTLTFAQILANKLLAQKVKTDEQVAEQYALATKVMTSDEVDYGDIEISKLSAILSNESVAVRGAWLLLLK